MITGLGGLRPRRLLPASAAAIGLALLAFYLPSRPGGPAHRVAAGRTGGANTDIPGAGAASGDTVPGGGATSGATGAAINGSAAVASGGSAAVGGAGHGKTGSAAASAAASRATYPGVTDKDVTVVFAYMHETCGQDPSAFVNQLGPPGNPDASIQAAVDYFNKHSMDVFGRDVPANLKPQLGSSGFYGRNLKPVIVDDHGQFCAEQSRADAQQAAESYKPFASIGGSDTEWDDEMTSHHIIRVSFKPALDKYFLARQPYLWGPITGASTINRFLAQYTGHYLKGQKTGDTGDINTAHKDRVYGVIYQDDPDTNDDVNDFKAELSKRGISLAKAFAYQPNLGTIGSQATSAILQMRQAGVTSIFMIMDPIATEFMNQSADSQSYQPEWISSTYGLMDNSIGPRTFMSAKQVVNLFGISAFLPSRQVPAEEVESYKAWQVDHPGTDPPSDFDSWYGQLKLVARGVALAGPTLDPNTFFHGYSTSCHPCSRVNPTDPLIGYGPGDFTATDDAHRQHYDPNAPDYTVPKSQWQNGQPPKGAYTYDDNGKRSTSFD